MEFKNIVPGMTFEKEFIVEEGDTASHFGNDKVPVFASPRLISWIEGTAIGTVAPFLPEGWETVGTTFDLAHLAATPVGMKVRVVTEVTEVKGKMLTYSVKAYDEVDKICEGTHGRAIIELDKFLKQKRHKIRSKANEGLECVPYCRPFSSREKGEALWQRKFWRRPIIKSRNILWRRNLNSCPIRLKRI